MLDPRLPRLPRLPDDWTVWAFSDSHGVRQGRIDWIETWLRYGGQTTLASYGVTGFDARHPATSLDALEICDPGLFAWLASLPEAVRWRDWLFVHGGLPPDHGLEDLGTITDEHLWIRSGFYTTPWGSPAFERYRDAGIERVVFGHTPQPDGPTLFHEGHSLCVDTNAVGNPDLPAGSRRVLTLIGLAGDDTFGSARLVTVDTRDAPDGAPSSLPGRG